MAKDDSYALGDLLEIFEAVAKDKNTGRTILQFDVDKYQSELDESGLDEDQKRQVVEFVFYVVNFVVDLGFDVHPLQEVCGKTEEAVSAWGQEHESVVSSERTERRNE